MGDDGDELEGIAERLAKAPFRIIRSYGVPAAVALGIGAPSLLYAVHTADASMKDVLEAVQTAVSDTETWKDIGKNAAIFLGSLYAFFLIRNIVRKRQCKEPANLWKMTKQMLGMGKKGKKPFEDVLEAFPGSSLAYAGLGKVCFDKGQIIEAMEAYYKSFMFRNSEFFPKLPVVGPNGYINAVTGNLGRLRKKLNKNPNDNSALLRMAMIYILLNDFKKSMDYFERVDKEEDPIALHALASRFYSEISKRAGKPKVRRLSFGDSRLGRIADKTFYFWSRNKIDKEKTDNRAMRETLSAVKKIMQLDNLEQYLERIGDYNIYKIGLNSFVRGFVVLKQPNNEKTDQAAHERLVREMANEQIFRQIVAKGKYKSVHPIGVVKHKKQNYLALMYEIGTPLSSPKNQKHLRNAMQFAARSDALMPLEYLISTGYNPRTHFSQRISEAVSNSNMLEGGGAELLDNSNFLFKYSKRFPKIFDGDWHADNCLVDEDGCIIALDKEDKGVTIGPVTAARLLNQGAGFPENQDDELNDDIINTNYIKTYQWLADNSKKIDEPELFLPAALASTIEKAITAYCFSIRLPKRYDSTRVLLRRALHAGQRLRNERQFQKFYSDKERLQCANIERIIYYHLLLAIRS